MAVEPVPGRLLVHTPNSPSRFGGLCYHVLNRGNARREVFLKDGDYQAFLKALAHACIEIPMPVLAYCLMPNRFHLVVWPAQDGDLSRWMYWLLNSHVRRYHQHYHSIGHLWRGGSKAFPVEADEHLLTVLRYVERNPVRAGLVRQAERWPWSSARWWPAGTGGPPYLAAGPVERGADWLERVNQALPATELERVRTSVQRGRPHGSEAWAVATAVRLGTEASLRPRGRPRKTAAAPGDKTRPE